MLALKVIENCADNAARISVASFFFIRNRISESYSDFTEILYQKWYLRRRWECIGIIWLSSEGYDKQNAKAGSNDLRIQHGADQLSSYELRGKAYTLSNVTMSLEI